MLLSEDKIIKNEECSKIVFISVQYNDYTLTILFVKKKIECN